MTNIPRVFAVELGPEDLHRLSPGQGYHYLIRFAAYVDGEPLRVPGSRIVRMFSSAELAERAGRDALAGSGQLELPSVVVGTRNTPPALACGVRRARRKGDR